MPKRITKESQAWREIARRMAEDRPEYEPEEGLCRAVDTFTARARLSDQLADQMYARQHGHYLLLPAAQRQAYYLEPDERIDWRFADQSVVNEHHRLRQENRIMAALFLALDAEDDEKRR